MNVLPQKTNSKARVAIVIGTGLDGAGALSSIGRICTGYRFKEVQEALIIKAPICDEDLVACRLPAPQWRSA